MTIPTQHDPAIDTLAAEQSYQDSLIVNRMPLWMRRLKIALPTDQNIPAHGFFQSEHDALCDALKASLECRQWLKKTMARIEQVDTFTLRMLDQAMRDTFGIDQASGLALRKWYTYFDPAPGISWGRYPLQQKGHYDVPLHDAALENFTEGEGKTDQHKDNCIVDGRERTIKAVSAPAFARMCRTLDLGAQYQRHLDSVLNAPASERTQWQSAVSTFARLYRSQMLIDACKAKSEGVLSPSQFRMVLALCKQGRAGLLDESRVELRQLTAFNCVLQQIVVFDVTQQAPLWDFTRQILVYIPGDPNGPWSVSTNLETFIRKVLGYRLRKNSYLQFFQRFVLRRNRQDFFSKVQERLGDLTDSATREMDQSLKDYTLPLFEQLAADRVAQIKDDAAMIATPVAMLDREAQEKHRERIKAEGWTLITLAGAFIPGLNTLLLAVMAWDMFGEIFHGLESWLEGDTRAAIDHFTTLCKDVAILGVTFAIVRGASRAWAAVDNWIPARLENGSRKLWNGDLQPFRSEAPPDGAVADAAGVWRAGDKKWIVMDGYYYQVVERVDSEWQLRPHAGHAPLLRHNQAGAWRLWCEQPASWTDTHRMFHRLGEPFSQLDPAQIDQALAIHGIEPDHLRALHVYARPAEAELVDTVQRLLIDRRIATLLQGLGTGRGVDDSELLDLARALPGAADHQEAALITQVRAQRRFLFQQLYQAQQAQGADEPAVAILRKAFPRLHRLAARQLLDAATSEDREYLNTHGKMSWQLTRRARQSVLRIRVARACEGLFIETPQSLDHAKVVLTLLDTLPDNAGRPHWRLYDEDALRPIFSSGGSGRSYRLVHRSGQFEVEDALGVPLVEASTLCEALTDVLDNEDRLALGLSEPYAESLRAALARQVAGRSELLAQVLGKELDSRWLQPPQRLDEGRIGYPLGGSVGGFARPLSRPRGLAARLRDLYPAYSDQQIDAWLVKLRNRNLDAELGALERQVEQLGDHLRQWESGAPLLQRSQYKEFRKGLLECWRELIPGRAYPVRSDDMWEWGYTTRHLRSLPALGAQFRFPHVQSLALRELRLKSIPDQFLLSFPNLKNLELAHNRLTKVPSYLALLDYLKFLDLSHNRIALDDDQVLGLAGCRHLHYLNLSDNRLGRTFSVRSMTQLRELRFAGNGLNALPDGWRSCEELYYLGAGNNSIANLPDEFFESDVWQTGYVVLRGNPTAHQQTAQYQDAWLLPDLSEVPAKLNWLDRLDENKEDFSNLWMQVRNKKNSSGFLELMRGLTRSRDFSHDRHVEILAARVFDLMEDIVDNEPLGEHILSVARLENCADSASVWLNQLEVSVLEWKAEQEAADDGIEEELIVLGRRLWRWHQVRHEAVLAARAVGEENESVEWALALSIELRERLDLPFGGRSMRFPAMAAYAPGQIDAIFASIRLRETEDNVARFMLDHQFWRAYVDTHWEEDRVIPARFHEQLEVLLARDPEGPEVTALQREQKEWVVQNDLQLTVAALQRHMQA
ncbi:conserved protein of unknown function [Pseudomonas sp. JV551A1]|uniref:RING-type E3 ubiquitin transferase n=1 Tax=Pseudomonas inefficax TaxID=2078786 RepID=A0AAQ1PDA7_9PSED|nr:MULTISPECIES: NEL-type E3 ubiquitin ligase domain-containing protein [Pseudomonas]SPO54522.1 conserved protein of unknown function [Pseudomonas sp. JV551A1]SPO62197.1 conserved protein of unknown function [Pseudomonas inefficax]